MNKKENFGEKFARVQAVSAEANAKQARKREQQATVESKRRADEHVDPSTAQQRTERSGDDAEIARLAALPPLQYEQERTAAAKRLKMRTSILDKLVSTARLADADDNGLQGGAVSFPEPEPWPEQVDGAALLDDIAAAIRRHVIMTDHARDICALWIVHTYVLDHIFITPRLCVRAPTKGCAKTLLLDVLGPLVLRPLSTSNVTAAALFRVAESYRPTFLIDEADTYLPASDELRGILNSGHRKGGTVLRTVGDEHEPRMFRTFAACAIALIGKLPDTLHDRSVVVDLKKRLPSEAITGFRPDRVGHLKVLARKAARWAADHGAQIGDGDPEMPEGVINRMADNWRALLAIADLAGGGWPERALRAAAAAAGEGAEAGDRLEMLLADIQQAFGQAEHLSSAVLVGALVQIEGRSWAEYGRTGKALTPNALARLLKPLGIAPQQIGPESERIRGYVRAHFEDAFARYLPSEGGSNRPAVQNPAKLGTSAISQPSSQEHGWTVEKCKKSNNDGLLDGWTLQKGGERVCAHCHHPEAPSDPVEDCVVEGVTLLLHRPCQRPFLAEAPAPPAGACCLLCQKGGDVIMVDLGDGRPAPLHRACANIIKADLADQEVAAWWEEARL